MERHIGVISHILRAVAKIISKNKMYYLNFKWNIIYYKYTKKETD